jgi:U32 family peptidase
MKALGLRHFRVELLRETQEEATALLDRYARILNGEDDGRTLARQLRVLNSVDATPGTLEFA